MTPFQVTLLMLLGAVALGLFTCAAALVLVWFAMQSEGEFLEPQDVHVQVDYPQAVGVGQPFTIEVRVTNDAETQTLHEIDIYHDYLEGIEIISSDPPYRSPEPTFGLTTYPFRHRMEPGETVIIRFQAVGKSAGRFSGDLDVCINNAFSFVSHPLQTDIVDTSESPDSTDDPGCTAAQSQSHS